MLIVATFESTHFKFPAKDIDELPEPPGKDVAEWLAARISLLGYEAMNPEPEDFGWYVTFSIEESLYQAAIGPVGDEFWFVVVERVVGFFPSILGFRRKHKNPQGLLVIHKAIKEAEGIDNLQWHSWKSFRQGGASSFKNGSNIPLVS